MPGKRRRGTRGAQDSDEDEEPQQQTQQQTQQTSQQRQQQQQQQTRAQQQQEQHADPEPEDEENNESDSDAGGDDDPSTTAGGGAAASEAAASGAGGSQQPAMTRKERKRLEAQRAHDAQLRSMEEASRNVHQGDSPFSVTVEEQQAQEGLRDISMNKVSVSVNGKAIFKETNVRFSAGARYGLIGPNGRGKSTLLRLLVDRELPVQQSLHMMLVAQEQEVDSDSLALTPVQVVMRSHKQMLEFETEAEELRNKDEGALTDEDMERLQFLEEELQLMSAGGAEAKARKILHGLGFPHEWQDRALQTFSGGWRKRVVLACAVFIEPDLLALDEPTNHLDLNALVWLEWYLERTYNADSRRPKTLILVSHDAGFLDTICTHMVHIDNFRLQYYRGSFSQFEAQVEQFHSEADKRYTQIQRLIGQKKREGMSNTQVKQWVQDQIRLGRIDPQYLERRRDYTVTFPFKQPPLLRDACIIRMEDVSFNYPGGPVLFEHVDAALWSDSRIVVCGPNGIGKSTLINLMIGDLEPTEGHAELNRQVRIGRYTQHFVDSLPLERTPVQHLISLGLRDEQDSRSLLGQFGLEGICHHQMMASLSGGQKGRVALAAMSTTTPHFMLLDEVTNHYDLEAVDALCDAINKFEGGVLCVTHDARLIENTNMQLWVVSDKNVRPFNGTLADYKANVRAEFEEQERLRELERERERDERRAVREHGSAAAVAAVRAAAAEDRARQVDDMFAAADAQAATKKPKPKPKPKRKKASGKSASAGGGAAAEEDE